jgi:N-acetylmuramoyl-L-alanine amidase
MRKSTPLLASFFSLALLVPAVTRALALLERDDVEIGSHDKALPGAGPQRITLVLDPGHGGSDMGAVVGGHREKDIALSIARRLKNILEARGAGAVRLTREEDTFIPLDQRIEESRDWSGTVFVSLHLNQVQRKRLHGITVFAFGKETFKGAGTGSHQRKYAPIPPPPEELAKASTELADSIVDSLRHQGLRVDKPAKAGFYVLKNPTIPSVLIELGYLSNPQEAARLIDPGYQDKLAQALAASLQTSLARLPASPL